MNDELPTALTILLVGLAITLFCTRGIFRAVRSANATQPDWGLVAISSGALFGGLAIAAFGGLYLDMLLFGRL